MSEQRRSRVTIQQVQRLSLNLSLTASIRVLRADAEGLTAFLEEQAAENPALVLTRPVQTEWLPRWSDALSRQATLPDWAEPAAAAPGLLVHVAEEIRALDLSPTDQRIAEALMEGLDPSGWLVTSVEEVAFDTGVSVPMATRVLLRLQRMDPPGLFARDLAECLRLQADEAGELDPPMAGVLACLPLIAARQYDRVARQIGATEAEVELRLARLRRYDPKPGARFAQGAAPVAEPDLVVQRGADGGWEVALNRSSLPTVSVAPGRGAGRAEARGILRMIQGRNSLLLDLAREMLRRQPAVLEAGLGALSPMTMTDVAQSLGVHQTTVSRLVAGTSMDTPRGTWWLRALFSAAVREDGPSGAALRDRLARLVAEEDPARPLTDEALATALALGGEPVARRTVAKYRAMLGIPPAHRRRGVPRRKATGGVASGADRGYWGR